MTDGDQVGFRHLPTGRWSESDVAAVVNLYQWRVEGLEAAMRGILEGAKSQGAHTGMSWLQVQQICERALGLAE
jgi:hypothetical protein